MKKQPIDLSSFSDEELLKKLKDAVSKLESDISEIEKKKLLLEITECSKELFNRKNLYIPSGMELAEVINEHFEDVESQECEKGYSELNITFYPVEEEPFREDLKNYLHRYDLGYGWCYTFEEKERKLYVRIEGECN